MTQYPLSPNPIFWTLQGEGHLRGFQMAFVRLAGCSVGCAQCDTDYRVDSRATAEEIVDRVTEVQPKGDRDGWVWITGGEPTDHNLRPLLSALKARGFSTAVVTSGVRRLIEPVDWLSVSPHSSDPAKFQQRYGNEMTPDTFGRAKKALEIGTADVKEQSLAEKFWGSSGNNIAGALKLARENLSGKEEDQVVQRLKIFENERTGIVQAAQNEAKDKAWRSYSESGNFSKIPPSVLASMDGADLASLQRTAKADVEARTKGTEVKTDPNVYYRLTQEAMMNPDFKDPAKVDLRKYFDKLSPGDRNHFINLQRTIGTKNEAPEAVTVQQQITATTKQLGLKDEKAGMFTSEANKALFAAQVQKGGKLDQAERQKVLDGLVLEGEVLSGSFFLPDSNMRRFEARARGDEAKFKPEFTDAQRSRATEALKRNGVSNPTRTQVDAVLYETYGIEKK
jgi:organic radical activating enzyme